MLSIKELVGEIRFWLTLKTDETNVELEDHPLGNQNIYRFHYVEFYYKTIGKDSSKYLDRVVLPFNPFILPVNMKREDAFKVMSYLSDYCAKKNGEENPLNRIRFVNEILKVLGFQIIRENIPEHSDKVIDLFVVDGLKGLFKRSGYYKKYFNWYIEGVTLEEFKRICTKFDLNADMYILDEDTPTKDKTLIKKY